MANISQRSGTGRKEPMNVNGNGLAFTEAVRSLAYELYESRGREDGHDVDDWLRAEQQILRVAA